MELRLNPPKDIQVENDAALDRVESDFACGRVKLSKTKVEKLERDIERMVDRWKEGTSPLRERLREWNDMLEGVTEEVDFPWEGASSVTMGVAAGMARTLAATFDRSIFSQERYLVMTHNAAGLDRKDGIRLEEAVNFLTARHNNLKDTLRDMPIPLFRDGTVPVMGEWERRVERVVDYKTYQAAAEFQADYPDPESAGMDEKRYSKVLRYLDKVIDPDLKVEYFYDDVVKDAPKFTMVPLARFVFYPLSIEALEDAILYGRQMFQSVEDARLEARFGNYDQEPTEAAIGAVKGNADDAWGYEREQIEGISSSGDDHKRLECYRLVLKKDLDGDSIPEKYLITYEHTSGRILSIRSYPLRKNIDNTVLFRFLKRDGRILGVALAGDGADQFAMIDDFHRHRQNVRAITDAPAFLVPDKLKDEVDFGSADHVWRPGVTLYVPDDYMGEKAPRQMIVQNLDRTNNSLDEEGGVMRYLEIRLGPSQGMSGKETLNDPDQPATKTIALLQQSTFRTDHYISEFKRSVPPLMRLHNALYYQYGPRAVKYMTKVKGKPFEAELENRIFAADSADIGLAVTELSLSPEYQMEKAQAILAGAAGNPVVLQLKPDILISAWNEFILALRPSKIENFLIEVGEGGMPVMPSPMGGPPMPIQPQQLMALMQQLTAAKGGGNPNKRRTQPNGSAPRN